MSAMKRHLEDLSVAMGFRGEITDEVLERAKWQEQAARYDITAAGGFPEGYIARVTDPATGQIIHSTEPWFTPSNARSAAADWLGDWLHDQEAKASAEPPLNVRRTYITGEVEMVSEATAKASLSGHWNGDTPAIKQFAETGKASSPHATYERTGVATAPAPATPPALPPALPSAVRVCTVCRIETLHFTGDGTCPACLHWSVTEAELAAIGNGP